MVAKGRTATSCDHLDDRDGRDRVVGLTDAGRRVIDDAFTEHMADERRLLHVVGPDDAATLEQILTSWHGRIEV